MKIELTLPEAKELEILPEDLPLDILYEDRDVILVNKPKGMVVHPSAGHTSGTLVNAMRSCFTARESCPESMEFCAPASCTG